MALMPRWVLIGLVAITLLAGGLRVYAIGSQALSPDDLQVPTTALNYVERGVPWPTMPFHPNLRNVLVYLSLQAFGLTPAGIKGWSMLLGTLCVPLLGLLMWRLTRNGVATLVPPLLLAVDSVNITFSRQAIGEVWTTFFGLAGVLVVVYMLGSRDRRWWTWGPVAAGVLFGLGVASKFYVVPVEAAAIGLLVYFSLKAGRRPEAVWSVIGTLGVSFLVFALTYLPWFTNGHGFFEWVGYQTGLVDTILTHSMPFLDNRSIRAWRWFVVPSEGWIDLLYAWPLPGLSLAQKNPVSWLAVLPAALWLLWKRSGSRANLVLQVLFWAAYLPLVFADRFMYLFAAVMPLPFAFGLVGLAASELVKHGYRSFVVAYLVLAVAFGLWIFPAAIGRALDFDIYEGLVRNTIRSYVIPPIQQQLDD